MAAVTFFEAFGTAWAYALRLWAVRDNITSWQRHEIEFTYA